MSETRFKIGDAVRISSKSTVSYAEAFKDVIGLVVAYENAICRFEPINKDLPELKRTTIHGFISAWHEDLELVSDEDYRNALLAYELTH